MLESDQPVAHVDGGVRQVVFLRDFMVALAKATTATKTPVSVYVVLNGGVGIDGDCTRKAIVPVALRSLEAVLDEAAESAVYRIFVLCLLERLDFKLRFVEVDRLHHSIRGGRRAAEGERISLQRRVYLSAGARCSRRGKRCI